MASVQSKIGWKRPRKTENKNYHPFRSFLALNRKLKKKSKKSKKINQYSYGFISSQNRLEKDEIERK